MAKKKYQHEMSDTEIKEYWSKITDPLEALNAVSYGSQWFGYDPYYGDLHHDLLEMVERVLKENSK
jgi:hypothetical protein